MPQALKKSAATTIVPSTGGKAPPAVVKQHQQMNKSLAAKNAAVNRSSSHVNKNAENIKRKSIFSPINSSESEEEPTKKQITPTKLKPSTQRGRPKKVIEKEPTKSSESSTASSTETSSSRYVQPWIKLMSLCNPVIEMITFKNIILKLQ